MAAVLGLALTVSSIIVQLAATRFTPHITSLFFRARTNLLVLGFFVTATVFVVWVNFSIGATYVPRWGVLFSMLLMTASLLLLFPYFAYVFDFLDPEKIVGRITANGLYACTPIRGRGRAGGRPATVAGDRGRRAPDQHRPQCPATKGQEHRLERDRRAVQLRGAVRRDQGRHAQGVAQGRPVEPPEPRLRVAVGRGGRATSASAAPGSSGRSCASTR